MVDEHGDEGMPESWLAGMCPKVLRLHCCCITEELCCAACFYRLGMDVHHGAGKWT